MKLVITKAFVAGSLLTWFAVGMLFVCLFPSGTKWADLGVGLVTGVVVGASLYLVDRQRAARERALADVEARRVEEERERRAREIADDALRQSIQGQKIMLQMMLSSPEIRNVKLDREKMNAMSFVDRAFENSRFDRCEFVESDFTRAIIDETFFTDCKLTSATFSFASIHDTSFAGAALIDVDFRNATLTGCDFRGASLDGAIFENAIVERCFGLEAIGI